MLYYCLKFNWVCLKHPSMYATSLGGSPRPIPSFGSLRLSFSLPKGMDNIYLYSLSQGKYLLVLILNYLKN
jgi:hypothetical protein